MTSTIAKGSAYEKKVKAHYEGLGYKVHRPIKSSFGTQDVFGIADLVVCNSTSFALVACAVGRFQSGTVRKIEAMLPFIPSFVKVEYRVLLKDGTEKVKVFN